MGKIYTWFKQGGVITIIAKCLLASVIKRMPRLIERLISYPLDYLFAYEVISMNNLTLSVVM